MFEIPVVLFFMKRKENTLKVIAGIEKVRPKKLYLISDGGRSIEEHKKVLECREAVQNAISWNCEIIRDYSEVNLGVLDRIGFGAIKVLEKEEYAIFLEDDNYPEESFFYFCEELLHKYYYSSNVLWICGTNYLEKYDSEYSYMFSKHTLPCGWASWSHKFLKSYDPLLKGLEIDFIKNNFTNYYNDTNLEKQKSYFIKLTKNFIDRDRRVASWDHQMTFSLMANRMLGIVPKVNLIRNIGVDADSTHGGSSLNNVMTRRFCSMDIHPISFPLIHPPVILEDKEFEKELSKIISIPWWYMLGIKFAPKIRRLLHMSPNDSISKYFFRILGK